MPQTSATGLYVPTSGDAPDIASIHLTQAADLDKVTVPLFASASARDAAYATTAFKLCVVGVSVDAGTLYMRQGGKWIDLTAPVADTGWVNVPVGASWTTPSTGSDHAMMRNIGGQLFFRGIIATVSGNFPTSQQVALISAGGLVAPYRTSNKMNRILSSTTTTTAQRGILDTDGSMSLTTNATTGSYVDISAFTGARTD